MDKVKLVNNGDTKRCAPGHNGIEDEAVLTASEAAVYRRRWAHLFESGELEVVSLEGESLEGEYDEELGRYDFGPSGETSDEGEASGEESGDEDEGPDYELDDVNARDLIEEIEAGEHDDELESIIENEDRSTVIEAAENRLNEDE